MSETKSKPAGVQQFSKHCAVLPKGEESLPDESLQFSDNRVSIHSAHGIDVRFHSIVKLVDDETDPVDSVIGPLLVRTKAGESTTVIFGGSRNGDLPSNAIARSSSVLLGVNKTDPTESKSCRVTFSWFNIDCESSEQLVDVLRAANPATVPSIGKTAELFLREAGHGKGVAVPGLLEIEIANDGDLQTLLSHLQATVPHVATFAAPSMHSVLQLTFTDLTKKKSVAGKDFVAMGSISDMLDVGKITFILLSDMVSSGPYLLHGTGGNSAPLSPKRPGSKVGRSKTEDVVTKGGYYPWVEHTKVVVQWLESRRASTPFHKSRLMLLLKDVLLRRQKAALLLILQPSLDQHQANLDWLRLVALLTRTGPSTAPASAPVPAAPIAASTAASPKVTTSAPAAKRRVSAVQQPPSDHSPAAPSIRKAAARRRSSSADSPPVHSARRVSIKAHKASPSQQLQHQQSNEAAQDQEQGDENTNSLGGSAGPPNGSPQQVPQGGAGAGDGKQPRRGSRLFRSTAKLLDLPESTLLGPDTHSNAAAGSSAQKKSHSLQKVTSLTPKEISAAMRELTLRNKKAARVAAMERAAEQMAPFPDTNTSTQTQTQAQAQVEAVTAELEELKRRLASMEDKCRALEVENVQLIMAQQQQQQQEHQQQEQQGQRTQQDTAARQSLEEQLRAALERVRELELLGAAEAEARAALVEQHQLELALARQHTEVPAAGATESTVTVQDAEPLAPEQVSESVEVSQVALSESTEKLQILSEGEVQQEESSASTAAEPETEAEVSEIHPGPESVEEGSGTTMHASEVASDSVASEVSPSSADRKSLSGGAGGAAKAAVLPATYTKMEGEDVNVCL